MRVKRLVRAAILAGCLALAALAVLVRPDICDAVRGNWFLEWLYGCGFGGGSGAGAP